MATPRHRQQQCCCNTTPHTGLLGDLQVQHHRKDERVAHLEQRIAKLQEIQDAHHTVIKALHAEYSARVRSRLAAPNQRMCLRDAVPAWRCTMDTAFGRALLPRCAARCGTFYIEHGVLAWTWAT